MVARAPHRGHANEPGLFAEKFILSRLEAFSKDIGICLTPAPLKDGKGKTHAYFPALAACCGTMEYFAALYRGGRLDTIGWPEITAWAARYLPQPDYNADTVRVFVQAFRNSIAHRGIASGVWIDRQPGPGLNRRLTWKVLADSLRPSIRLVPEEKALLHDSPWPCPYTHRVHIHLRSLFVDIRNGGAAYATEVREKPQLAQRFLACMHHLYPAA